MSTIKYTILAAALGLSLAATSPVQAHEQRAGTVRATEDGTVLIAARETLAPGATLDVVRHVHRPGPGKHIGTPFVHRVVGTLRVVGSADGGLVRAERVSGSAWRGDYVTASTTAEIAQR